MLSKGKWNQTPVFLLILFTAFFLFNLGSFFTGSMIRNAGDYYSQFITGDLTILHQESSIAHLFINFYSGPAGKRIPVLQEFSKIEKFLAEHEDIAFYTPFFLYPVTCMNKNRGKISLWLKVIEPQSFSKVFPEIFFTHTDKSPVYNDINGIFLPATLTGQLEDLLKTPLTEGDFLLISDENARISSVRETYFAGIVSHIRYNSIFPGFAYMKMNPIQTADQTEKTAGLQLPEEGAFYRDFITRELPIQKTTLPDSFFFEFFHYNRNVNKGRNTNQQEWQFIAVSIGEKNKIEDVKTSLGQYFDMNGYPAKVTTGKSTARPILASVYFYRLCLYTVILFLFITVVLLFIRRIKKYARMLKRNDMKTHYTEVIEFIKKATYRFYVSLSISAAAGIIASVLAVFIINSSGLSSGSNTWSTILAGGNEFLISVSPGPFLASLLIVVILIVVISIYPLILLAGNKEAGAKEKS